MWWDGQEDGRQKLWWRGLCICREVVLPLGRVGGVSYVEYVGKEGEGRTWIYRM